MIVARCNCIMYVPFTNTICCKITTLFANLQGCSWKYFLLTDYENRNIKGIKSNFQLWSNIGIKRPMHVVLISILIFDPIIIFLMLKYYYLFHFIKYCRYFYKLYFLVLLQLWHEISEKGTILQGIALVNIVSKILKIGLL